MAEKGKWMAISRARVIKVNASGGSRAKTIQKVYEDFAVTSRDHCDSTTARNVRKNIVSVIPTSISTSFSTPAFFVPYHKRHSEAAKSTRARRATNPVGTSISPHSCHMCGTVSLDYTNPAPGSIRAIESW